MLTENLALVFAIGGILAILTIIQFILAWRHDHAVSIAGPLEEYRAIEARVNAKREDLKDLDEDLKKRQAALENLAKIGADVEELQRRRDELLAEWSSLEEKREEVRAVRAETEQAVVEKQSQESELAAKQAELEEVRERLEKAEQLVGRIDALKTEKEVLAGEVDELRDELRDLQEAEARVAALNVRAQELEASNARLDGQVSAKEDQLDELRAEVATERRALADDSAERSRLAGEIAASTNELKQLQKETESLSDRRVSLEARLAHLEAEIAAKAGQATGKTSGAGDDPLRELKEMPPVLRAMKEWDESAVFVEAEALKKVGKHFEIHGLEYHPRVLRAFHTAMKVNESTQMAVLAGISGTGKSQLPRVYSEGMGIGFLQVPVQPRWDSPQDLMGFYNYIEGRYRPTDMAKALWALDEQNNEEAVEDRMMMVLLDEMNLARVEYYFSDFLSRLESRPRRELVGDRSRRKDAEIELELPSGKGDTCRIFPGYNLLFAGTMNEDESTQSLSDKVVDRANVLRFSAPKTIKSGQGSDANAMTEALSQRVWQKWVKPVSLIEKEAKVTDSVDRMVDLMRDFKRPIGHRLGRAIKAYVANYPDLEGSNRLNEAIADQVEMRLLPKLRGVEIEQASTAFDELRSFVDRELGDNMLADAIGDALQAAEATGQFVWTGVTR